MPSIIPIGDPEDPRLAPYRAIRERDLVGRAGQFIAEGRVVIEALLRAKRHAMLSLLLAERRVETLAPLIARLPPGTPVYAAPQALIDSIAGFSMHRGLLALGARGPDLTPAELLRAAPRSALILVLIGIANHDNLGGIFRNAAAFGVSGVLLDETCCDPLYRKAIRVSVGGSLLVPFARLGSGMDIMGLLEAHGFEALALSPAGATPLSALARPCRAAVILGAEGPGLPPELLARARTIGIPMKGEFDSLNVATTSGIVLHYLEHMALSAG